MAARQRNETRRQEGGIIKQKKISEKRSISECE